MCDVNIIRLEDFGGDFDKFLEACYTSYCNLWQNNPVFNSKQIVRDKTLVAKGFEKTFWGIVDGHDNCKIYDTLIRYKRIPVLNIVLGNDHFSPNLEDSKVKWFVFDRKIRLFSETDMYEIILKEMRKAVFLVTAFPINEKRLNTDKKLWKTYWKMKTGA